jgi:hypothetical protein
VLVPLIVMVVLALLLFAASRLASICAMASTSPCGTPADRAAIAVPTLIVVVVLGLVAAALGGLEDTPTARGLRRITFWAMVVIGAVGLVLTIGAAGFSFPPIFAL